MSNGTPDYKAGRRDEHLDHLASSVQDLSHRVTRLERIVLTAAALGAAIAALGAFVEPVVKL